MIEKVKYKKEVVDIYNKNYEKIGEKIRGEKIEQGEYILIINCWAINDKGQVLIQKRQPWKTRPNMWACSAGGHASKGDTEITATLREVSEEIGYSIKDVELKDLYLEKYMSHDAFIFSFYFNTNKKATEFTPQEEEVSEVKWVSLDQLKAINDEGMFFSTVNFEKDYENLCRVIKN